MSKKPPRGPARLLVTPRLAFVPLCLLLCACSSHTVNYSLGDVLVNRSARHQFVVAITPLDHIQKSGNAVRGSFDFTWSATEAVARHFDRVKLFEKQEIVADEFRETTPANLRRLSTMNYEAVLVGTFHVSMSDSYQPRGGTGIVGALIPIVGIIGDVAQERRTGRSVEFTTLRLIDTQLGRVLWQGMVSAHEYKAWRAITIDRPKSIDELAKEAIGNLVAELTKATLR